MVWETEKWRAIPKHLLANPLDLGLQFYNEASDVRRARLRSHCVDLAKHLLRHEIELLSCRLFALHGLLELFDVMAESRQLLGDIPFFHHDHDFLGDPILAHFDARLRCDLLDALLVSG